MTLEILTALAVFALATSVTPGPNNLMLMASGANFGFLRSVPHMLGIGIGFTVMLLMVGAGLIQVFDAYPVSHTILKVVSVLYMGWLAWKTATAAGPAQGKDTARPLTFLQAAGFQWVNPKAWAMALTAMTVYAPDRTLTAVLAVALVFGAINLPSVSLWTLMGQQVARLLRSHRQRVIFNITMAGLLIASLIPLLRP